MRRPALAIVLLGILFGGCSVEGGGIGVETGATASALEAAAADDGPNDAASSDGGGTGAPARPNGAACASAQECGSGHCVGGMCCATECVGAGTTCGGTCDGRLGGTCRYPGG